MAFEVGGGSTGGGGASTEVVTASTERAGRPSDRRWRVAVVTETWPPEVNGVAATVSRVVDGLAARGHAVEVVRPRQATEDETRAGVTGWARQTVEAEVDEGAAAAAQSACAATRRHAAARTLWAAQASSGSGLRPHGTAEVTHLLARGLPIPRYPDLRLGLPFGRRLRTRWRVERPDVVHIATEGPLGWSALQEARRLGLPVVSDFRTNFHAYSRHYAIGGLAAPVLAYLRAFHNRTQCTMVPTPALRDELAAAGFENLRVVARGVDAERFHPRLRSDVLRAGWGANGASPVALCVGRLAAEKNLGAVIAAFDGMRRQVPVARLVFVGDGPCRADLMRRCPDAVFAGQRHGADLAAHYASADVFLFPSRTETFGNVVPEAMASGLAVLAYDRAAARELIRSGDNGLLAPDGDEAAFCRLALRFVEDRSLAAALGERARRTALGLDWGRIVDAIEGRYRVAIDAAASVTQLGIDVDRRRVEVLPQPRSVTAPDWADADFDRPLLR